MTEHQQVNLRDSLIFVLLIAIGACGRWAQPEWCFTPIAAVTIFAGYYFSRWPIAVLVPILSLAISDLLLPAYDQRIVLLVTYLAMTFPVFLGRMLRNRQLSGSTRTASNIYRWALSGLVPATIFFVTTNFAVWAFKSNYDKTLVGLGECYLAAVPFFRWMIAGDIFYLTVIFGCFAIAGVGLHNRQLERAKA